jgi:two-component system response regulator FixJ
MPGISGLELHKELTDHRIGMPVIFLTGHGDVTSAVKAMKEGAVDYLQKPADDRTFLDAIRSALVEDARRRQDKSEYEAIAARLALLTPREREVLRGVAAGKTSKAIAYEFGISRKTVDVHRSRIMEKMNVRSVAELMTLLSKVKLTDPPVH